MNTKERRGLDPLYAIVGAGIRIVFSYRFADKEIADNLATVRARNLNCALYYRDRNGDIFQVHPEKKPVPKRAKIDASVYPEMMSDIQANSGYSSLNFV